MCGKETHTHRHKFTGVAPHDENMTCKQSKNASPGVHGLRVELVVQGCGCIPPVPKDQAVATVPRKGPLQLDQLLQGLWEDLRHVIFHSADVPCAWDSAQEHLVLWAKALPFLGLSLGLGLLLFGTMFFGHCRAKGEGQR